MQAQLTLNGKTFYHQGTLNSSPSPSLYLIYSWFYLNYELLLLLLPMCLCSRCPCLLWPEFWVRTNFFLTFDWSFATYPAFSSVNKWLIMMQENPRTWAGLDGVQRRIFIGQRSSSHRSSWSGPAWTQRRKIGVPPMSVSSGFRFDFFFVNVLVRFISIFCFSVTWVLKLCQLRYNL